MAFPTYTYDPTTPTGVLRLLIQDTDMSAIDPGLALDQRSAAFADEELAAFLGLSYNDYFYAASVALRSWSSNPSLMVVARTISKTEVNYGNIRADMQKAADAYYQQSINTPADAIAEISWTDPALRSIIMNAWLRQLG